MDQYLIYRESRRTDIVGYNWPAYDYHYKESKLVRPIMPHPTDQKWSDSPIRSSFMYPQHVRDLQKKIWEFPKPKCYSFNICNSE